MMSLMSYTWDTSIQAISKCSHPNATVMHIKITAFISNLKILSAGLGINEQKAGKRKQLKGCVTKGVALYILVET